jgi:flagellar protein FlaG
VAHSLGNSIEPVATVAAPSPLGVSASTPGTAAAPSKLVAPLAHAADPQSAISNPNATALHATLEKINAQLVTSGQSLQLSVDSHSRHIIVVVRDTQTGTIIRQLPSEEVLRLASLLGTDPHLLIDLTV